ncbi:CPBP family intramembrane glutamic endopeptidase [Bacillus taeanensis]|uniref:CPBP family intramembrane metalloprotease n=1 Tax=Bacillus taeanensis TaxID=273032 RepID=A0A366XMJ9_9BACI|nr:type II CAAX endopeptidase family protein [Bacillus taeanensis]RBW67580.1 CPBP family intramembrane metalloprotease [Bacillus taeanensis]
MQKKYWWILTTYILMQLSSLVGMPVLINLEVTNSIEETIAVWSMISFTTGLIIILALLKNTGDYPFKRSEKASPAQAAGWAIFGIFLAYMAQALAVTIEMNVFGIEPGSENTQELMTIAKAFPLFIILTSIIGPILEEIVFRKVIFGSLYARFNFWISALISSIIFGLVHMELSHLLIYSAMGFTFAFLYVKTKRILVPMIAHVSMNTLVAIVQILLGDRLIEIQKQMEQMQNFIGGF